MLTVFIARPILLQLGLQRKAGRGTRESSRKSGRELNCPKANTGHPSLRRSSIRCLVRAPHWSRSGSGAAGHGGAIPRTGLACLRPAECLRVKRARDWRARLAEGRNAEKDFLDLPNASDAIAATTRLSVRLRRAHVKRARQQAAGAKNPPGFGNCMEIEPRRSPASGAICPEAERPTIAHRVGQFRVGLPDRSDIFRQVAD